MLHSFLQNYAHAHSPIVPVLIALGSFLVDPVRAYVALSFGAGVLSAVLLLRLLRELEGISEKAAWILWSVGVSHFLVVKLLARTSTDGFGYLFVVLGLFLANRLVRRDTWSLHEVGVLSSALALGMFTRPTVVPLSSAIGLALLIRGWAHPRRPRVLSAALAVWLVPLALFFGGIALMGLWPSLALARQKMDSYAGARTADRLAICLVVMFQLLVIPLVLGARRAFQRPDALLGWCWVAATTLFVILTGTYWNRHFVHAVPGLLICAAFATERGLQGSPRWTRGLAFGMAGANLLLICFNLYRDVGLGAPYLFQ